MAARWTESVYNAVLCCWSAADGLWTKQPVLKSWGRRYGVWLGFGRQDAWTAPITRSWLTTVLPPYMRGTGVNIALGHNSIRIGWYKALGKWAYDEYDDIDVDGELEALGWALGEESVEVIATWTTQPQPRTETEPAPTATLTCAVAPSSSALPT